MLRWHQTVKFKELVSYYQGLIRLRKKLPGLCDKSPSAVSRIHDKKIHKDGVVSFCLNNCVKEHRGQWDELLIVYNASSDSYMVDVPEGQWVILSDNSEADCERIAEKEIQVHASSGMLLGRKVECV